MNYTFEIDIYTDGDFHFPYIPCGMEYNDDNYHYYFKKSYKDRDKAIKDVLNICAFLKEQMYTSRDYVKVHCDRCIDNFVERLKASDKAEHERIVEYISGNYDMEFNFRTEKRYLNYGFYVTEEEFETIKSSTADITSEMIKDAVMTLFKE